MYLTAAFKGVVMSKHRQMVDTTALKEGGEGPTSSQPLPACPLPKKAFERGFYIFACRTCVVCTDCSSSFIFSSPNLFVRSTLALPSASDSTLIPALLLLVPMALRCSSPPHLNKVRIMAAGLFPSFQPRRGTPGFVASTYGCAQVDVPRIQHCRNPIHWEAKFPRCARWFL